MRKKFLAGNWKMNMTPAEGSALVTALRRELDRDAAALVRNREVMIAPPFLTIPAVAQALAGSSILLGAQNMHFEEKGAFTGEISAAMLKYYGVSHVIAGHSERRHIFKEDDALVGKRAAAVIAHRMTSILCVGETAEERDAGKTLEIVLGQFRLGSASIAEGDAARLILAYEPVWAIGTGRNATPEQAEEVHAAIRSALASRYNPKIAEEVRIIYGGSVTPDNVDSLMAKPDIDGALVGGASLKADSFARIVRAHFG